MRILTPGWVLLPLIFGPAVQAENVQSLRSQNLGTARSLVAQSPTLPLEGFAESQRNQPVYAPFRREGPLKESSRPGYIVTRRQIQVQGARTVQEALKYLPGVLSDGTAGTQLGARSSQFIRGSDNSQTLVLLDGRPISDLGLFGGYDLSELTTDSVERVEVVPGGGSTLYGADAVGGVINIVTRAPAQTPATTVRFSAGSFGLNAQSFQTSGTSGPVGWRFGYDRTATTSDFPFTIAEANISGVRQNDDALYNNFNARLKADLSSHTELTFNLLANHKDLGVPGGVPLPLPGSVGAFNSLTPDNRQFTNNWLLDLGIRSRLGEGEDSVLTGRFYTDLLNYRFDSPISYGTRDEVARQTYGLQLQHNWQVTPEQKLIYGFDLRSTQARNTTYDYPLATTALNYDGQVSQGALFVQDEISPIEGLHLNLGVRQDQSSIVNGAFTSPSAGLRWEVGEDTTLRANYAHSFRAPLISDLFYKLRSPFFRLDGNPNLRPEQADSYDLGIDQKIGEIALVRLTYFTNTIADAISFSFDPTFTSGSYTNLGLVRTTGIEATADIQLAPHFYLSLNVTGNEPRILQDANSALPGRELSFRGADSFNASLAYESPGGWYAGIFLHSLGRFFIDNENTEALSGYTTTDLKMQVPLDSRLRLNTQINNLFNQQYQVYPGYPGVGINFRVDLALTL